MKTRPALASFIPQRALVAVLLLVAACGSEPSTPSGSPMGDGGGADTGGDDQTGDGGRARGTFCSAYDELIIDFEPFGPEGWKSCLLVRAAR